MKKNVSVEKSMKGGLFKGFVGMNQRLGGSKFIQLDFRNDGSQRMIGRLRTKDLDHDKKTAITPSSDHSVAAKYLINKTELSILWEGCLQLREELSQDCLDVQII
jgi:hypothetical protein